MGNVHRRIMFGVQSGNRIADHANNFARAFVRHVIQRDLLADGIFRWKELPGHRFVDDHNRMTAVVIAFVSTNPPPSPPWRTAGTPPMIAFKTRPGSNNSDVCLVASRAARWRLFQAGGRLSQPPGKACAEWLLRTRIQGAKNQLISARGGESGGARSVLIQEVFTSRNFWFFLPLLKRNCACFVLEHQPEGANSNQERSAVSLLDLGCSCWQLVSVTPEIALITQRSEVQILPPQLKAAE